MQHMSDETVTAARLLAVGEPSGRRLLATTVLGSGMGFLDGTIANVALPHIGADLHADLAGLQWVVNGYTLSLASLILVGGSLGDRLGRKRVYAWGIAGFAIASALVGLSPTIGLLVVARVLQGMAAALLTPGSLALIQSSFRPEDRMRAVGAWTGTLGIATAGGPVVGGWLVGIDWRIAFWINVPLAAVVLLLLRSAPESRNPAAVHEIDWWAAALAPVALAGITWALTAWPEGGASPTTVLAFAVGVLAGAVFVVVELRRAHPMVPPAIFSSRDFSVINGVTLFVYAALAGSMLFLAIFLQVSAGWTPLEAGAATVPVSVLMFFLASRFGALATKFGARPFMMGGATVLAAGFAWLAVAPDDPSYLRQILPGVAVMGLGLSMLVAPLTGAVLAAVPDTQAGLASGINNAVSRTGGLIAVAVLPLLTGLSGTAYQDGSAVGRAYRGSMWWCVVLAVVGGLITVFGLRRGRPAGAEHRP